MKTYFWIIVVIIVLGVGYVGYKMYKKSYVMTPEPQPTTGAQTQTVPTTATAVSPDTNTTGTDDSNTVDPNASLQEQQIENDLNALDNGGDTN